MKPRNKREKLVVALSQCLPRITEKHISWAKENCFTPHAYQTRKEIVCLECEHTWENNGGYICPKCGKKLEVLTSRHRTIKEIEYFAINTTCKGFQVLRYFYIIKVSKARIEAYYSMTEVVQLWINAQGKVTVIALNRNAFAGYNDAWSFSTHLEIRNMHYCHNIFPTKTYPRQRLLPNIRRNGFTGEFHELTPCDLFASLLSDKYAETLLKTGQIPMLQAHILGKVKAQKVWAAIKICIRNKYQILNPTDWRDYIDLLTYFGIDTHNPKYACPDNLVKEHDRLVAKKRSIIAKQRAEEKRAEIEKADKQYQKQKAKYFGIHIADGDIEIVPLKSVHEFLIEGDELNHCVFTNDYFKKSESLILSARKENKRLETIEVSLTKMNVVQCRGRFNHNTEYHDRILDLIRNNINQIKSCKAKNKKQEQMEMVA